MANYQPRKRGSPIQKVGELSLIRGKIEEQEYDPDIEIDIKKAIFIGDDGTRYQLLAGPEIEDLSTLNKGEVLVLGLIQTDMYDNLTVIAAGYRCLPKPDRNAD